LGLVGYYRRFIDQLATLASQQRTSPRKHMNFAWLLKLNQHSSKSKTRWYAHMYWYFLTLLLIQGVLCTRMLVDLHWELCCSVPLLLRRRGGMYGNYGSRHVATLVSAARIVYSIGSMATSFSALLATNRHRVQEWSSQPCGCSHRPNLKDPLQNLQMSCD
jgi:hypothetical protein